MEQVNLRDFKYVAYLGKDDEITLVRFQFDEPVNFIKVVLDEIDIDSVNIVSGDIIDENNFFEHPDGVIEILTDVQLGMYGEELGSRIKDLIRGYVEGYFERLTEKYSRDEADGGMEVK